MDADAAKVVDLFLGDRLCRGFVNGGGVLAGVHGPNANYLSPEENQLRAAALMMKKPSAQWLGLGLRPASAGEGMEFHSVYQWANAPLNENVLKASNFIFGPPLWKAVEAFVANGSCGEARTDRLIRGVATGPPRASSKAQSVIFGYEHPFRFNRTALCCLEGNTRCAEIAYRRLKDGTAFPQGWTYWRPVKMHGASLNLF